MFSSVRWSGWNGGHSVLNRKTHCFHLLPLVSKVGCHTESAADCPQLGQGVRVELEVMENCRPESYYPSDDHDGRSASEGSVKTSRPVPERPSSALQGVSIAC